MEERICYSCFQPFTDGGTDFCPNCGAPLAQNWGKYPHALPYGTALGGQYITGRKLGQGGFGITDAAQDYKSKQIVAIKEFFPDGMVARGEASAVVPFSGQREEYFHYGKSSFLEEARILSQFNGVPGIVKVYSYFEEHGTAYFAMEFVDGASLQDYINQQGGRLSPDEAKRILYPVMDALSAVHAQGIIHRDIKPDNIYIGKQGDVKVLDFGSARYSMGEKSRSLDMVLTHGFAPREQYSRHGRQGAYTDVYALAATFYCTVTGRVPPDSIDRLDEDTLVLPSTLGARLSPAEEDALLQALAVEPRDRFDSMAAFKAAMQSAKMEPEPKPWVQPRPEPHFYPEEKSTPRPPLRNKKSRKLWMGIAAGCLAVLVILGSWSVVKIANSSGNSSDSEPTLSIREDAATEDIVAEDTAAEDAAKEDVAAEDAGTVNTAGETRVFKHGFDLDYPPYSYVNDDGEIGGFDVEMAQAVCKYYNWEYEAVPFNWDAKDAELNAGSCDCIWSGFTLNGREDYYLWSKADSDNTQMIMVKKDSGIETLADLAGKAVGVQVSTTAYDLFSDEEGQAELRETFSSLEVYETYAIAFNDLKAGAIDAIAIDVTSGNFLMSGETDYVFLDEELGSEQYAIAFRKDDTELCELVNAAFDALVEDGAYDEIGRKYPEIYDFLCLND